jgi:hypothetical protein
VTRPAHTPEPAATAAAIPSPAPAGDNLPALAAAPAAAGTAATADQAAGDRAGAGPSGSAAAPQPGKPAKSAGPVGRLAGVVRERLGGPGQLVAALLLALSLPVALVGALLPSWWLVAAGMVAGYLAEWALRSSDSPLVRLLRRARFGMSLRMASRHLILVGLLALHGDGDGVLRVTVCALIAVQLLQAGFAVGMRVVVKRRQLPVVTRNIDVEGLRIGNVPVPGLLSRGGELVLFFDVFAVAGVIASAVTGATVWSLAGSAVTVAALLVCCVILLPHVLGRRGPLGRDAALAWLDRWMREYRPTTVLYFSGSLDSGYQAAMWLEPLSRLPEGERPLVLLRERALVPQLELTALPVVCVPSAVHLMNVDLSSVRVALYPANVGKNIHLLRVPHIKHVFIGHGDSDKLASVNPFSKAYDEVWTAGRAGCDRYAIAEVGVRAEDLVEVGRPQLSDVRQEPPTSAIPTVLYAPTWEGWTNDPGNTSVLTAGENIVRQLLAADPPVRVLYKPHPFTGTVNPAAGAAHRRIVALIERANAQRTAGKPAGTPSGNPAPPELARIQAELAKLTGGARPVADEAELARDGVITRETMARVRALREEWAAAYWAACPEGEHRVIEGAGPDLFSCFNQCHLMVSDISSVVSDFVASRKPYAITDSAGLGAEEFRRRNTAARAAYVVEPDGAGVDDLVAVLRGDRPDELAADRRELKEYLLGTDEPDSQHRFGAAIRDLARRADERLRRLEGVEGMEAGAKPLG